MSTFICFLNHISMSNFICFMLDLYFSHSKLLTMCSKVRSLKNLFTGIVSGKIDIPRFVSQYIRTLGNDRVPMRICNPMNLLISPASVRKWLSHFALWECLSWLPSTQIVHPWVARKIIYWILFFKMTFSWLFFPIPWWWNKCLVLFCRNYFLISKK